MPTPTTPQAIPVVDLAMFLGGDATDQARFVEQLGRALVEYGFAAVENHGVGRDEIQGAYGAVRDLFALPLATKLRYERPHGGRQRGYTSFGQEHAKDHAVPDMKEFWHVGPELPPTHPLHARLQTNLWPSELPTFKSAALALYASLHTCGQALLRAIARYLDASEDAFIGMIDGGNTILRMIRYPAPGEVEIREGAVWAAAHEDINLITLLPEATDPGLQLLQRDGRWLDIAPIPGQVIMDSGDMLQRLTNGVIPSTTHRVLAPRTASGPRYSIPFFVHPQPDYMLTPLPQCVTPERPRRWEDITAEGYLVERIREIGVATAQGHAGRYT